MLYAREKARTTSIKANGLKCGICPSDGFFFVKTALINSCKYTQRYGEQRALIILLAILDMPYWGATYKGIIENNNIFNVGLYIRMLNGRQYQYQTFANTIVSDELLKSDGEVREEREAKWSKSDKQNRAFVTSVVGYDPFENSGMSEEDRKYCFNILAGYCDADGIREDGHKIQASSRLRSCSCNAASWMSLSIKNCSEPTPMIIAKKRFPVQKKTSRFYRKKSHKTTIFHPHITRVLLLAETRFQ